MASVTRCPVWKPYGLSAAQLGPFGYRCSEAVALRASDVKFVADAS